MRFSFAFLLGIVNICLAQEKLPFEAGMVNFSVNNAGWNVEGTIGGLDGYLMWDEQHDEILKIEGSVDVHSINTGITLRDNHLKKADYFDALKHSKIVMSSVQLQETGDRKFEGTFSLTIKDTTKSVILPFHFTKTKDIYTLTTKYSINRLDFGIGEESNILSDTVRVTIEVKGKL